jgi:hypothetical protein
VPNQRFVVEKSQATLDVEALPIWPKRPLPPENTALKAAASNDPGLIAVLRSVQRIESEDVARLRRYVKDTGGTLSVETFLDNEDVRAARWMTWYRDAAGQMQGPLPAGRHPLRPLRGHQRLHDQRHGRLVPVHRAARHEPGHRRRR